LAMSAVDNFSSKLHPIIVVQNCSGSSTLAASPILGSKFSASMGAT
jgi:hypothetical protein